MKRSLMLCVVLLAAATAQASYYPRFETNWVTMQVGEKRTIEVRAMWSGLVDMGPHNWTFHSRNPEVATVVGSLAVGSTALVEITAVGPGTTSIIDSLAPGAPRYVEITVGADAVPPRIDFSAFTTTAGKPVTLSLNWPGTYCWCQWYEGRIGDISKPIGTGRDVIVTPMQPGTQYYWVMVMTAFVASNAEAAIEVRAPRVRSVRH